MADDADVQAPDITPDDFDGEQEKPEEKSKETPKADSSPVEDKPDVVEEAQADSKETEAEAPAESDETDKPQGKAEERKAQLNTEIRDLVSQRNALKDEVAKANAEVYQPATEDELVDQGLTATDAKVEALRQRIEVKDYNDRVADAQLTISSEAERVLQDFPAFNPDSADFDKELAAEAAQLLQANLIIDPNTQQVIGSNVSPYQLYKTLARASGISATKGQIRGRKDTEQMLANADVGSSASPPKKPADPLAALWEGDL